jgi:hypothetical protein
LENPVKLLNYSVHGNSNLSKSIQNNNQTNITNLNTSNIYTSNFNLTTTLSSTTTLSPTTSLSTTTLSTTTLSTTTLSTTTLSTTTLSPTTLSPTTTLSPMNKSTDVIVEPYEDRKINYTQNSSTQFYDVEKSIVNTVQDTTLQIVVITASSMCCCFSIISYFVWKAHRKQIKKLESMKDPEKAIPNNTIGSEKLERMRYYTNKIKKGNRLQNITLKNRNSWSKDNRVKPDLPPKLPHVSQPKLSVPPENKTERKFNRNKKNVTLDTKEKAMNFKIKELVKGKNTSDFVPGSPRRRLPTPPTRAPPPPAPEFASKSLANKLDFLSMNKTSPKIERIVRKDK